jgi:uncharacterized protein (DUF2267 family)
MTHDENLSDFYHHVQEKGSLRTREHAKRWSEGVLKTLGVNLDRKTKKELAQALPKELADPLTRVFWLLHFRDSNLSSYEFQHMVARRSGNTDPEFARHPILAVFGGVKQMIDADLEKKVAESLAPEVRDLWQEA